MNRRAFFRSLAKGVLATAAGLYAPRLLEERGPDHMRFSWERGMEVPDWPALMRRHGHLLNEQARWEQHWQDAAQFIGLDALPAGTMNEALHRADERRWFGPESAKLARNRRRLARAMRRHLEAMQPRQWFRLDPPSRGARPE